MRLLDLGIHLLLLFTLSLAVSAVVSGYREERPREVLCGTLRRFGKFSLFSLVLAVAMFFVEWIAFS